MKGVLWAWLTEVALEKMARRLCRSVYSIGRVSLVEGWTSKKPAHQLRRALHLGRVLSSDTSEPSRGMSFTSSFNEATVSATKGYLLPAYRVMDTKGQVLNEKDDPQFSDSDLKKMYEEMVTLRVMDEQLYKAQRMGLTSFYMMNVGEEATQFGSAAGLDPDDMIYAQYREVGVFLWRGFSVDDCMDQCFSNRREGGRGRQMPVHYGSHKFNIQFISSCLATQMPHAPGYAYGLKLAGSKQCVAVYFGDGAAQEGDAHAAMNFAATLGCPVLFICRNNGYAISTPASENYVGDGIASRGPGYGMETIRVDGNDVFAMYNVTKYARDVAVAEQRPILIEAMTYRVGSHSTSDDQTGYQDMDEVKQWTQHNNPMERLRLYMEAKGLWTQDYDDNLRKSAAEEVKNSMKRARAEPKPNIDLMFEDVYDKLPHRLQQQKTQMKEIVNKYKDQYPIDRHES